MIFPQRTLLLIKGCEEKKESKQGKLSKSLLFILNYLKYHTLMIKIEAYYCDDRVFYEILKTSNANLETNSKVIVSNLFKKFMSD